MGNYRLALWLAGLFLREIDMPTGNLKIWNTDRGFGFLSDDTGPRKADVFVHASAFRLAGVEPELGDVFAYGTTEREGKPIAVHLQRIWSPRDAH